MKEINILEVSNVEARVSVKTKYFENLFFFY